jgi:hypothetical protein
MYYNNIFIFIVETATELTVKGFCDYGRIIRFGMKTNLINPDFNEYGNNKKIQTSNN